MLGDEAAHDDVAILLLEFVDPLTDAAPACRAKRWTFDVTSRRRIVRRAARWPENSRGHRVSEEHVTTAELIVAELLGNVVRYARGRVEVVLDCSAKCRCCT